ncbi:hypothetical protein EVAR_82106_1 [Eumeta japonica]|uniref:Uncharacterized protein n=1 Tax=Eumeta variegata TaxID=151549 RepID=A0A4C1U1J3_EUMVA|nr:hypothetical protein EVAR_82106_1 [Eumeta japonica]
MNSDVIKIESSTSRSEDINYKHKLQNIITKTYPLYYFKRKNKAMKTSRLSLIEDYTYSYLKYASASTRSQEAPSAARSSEMANQRDGTERNSPFCLTSSSLSAAAVVSSTHARLCWFYTKHVEYTCGSQ